MNWDSIWNIIKIAAPYIFEVIKVILNGPHKIAMNNLREKGIVKDK